MTLNKQGTKRKQNEETEQLSEICQNSCKLSPGHYTLLNFNYFTTKDPIIFNTTNYSHKFRHNFATDRHMYTFFIDENDHSLTKLARLCAETCIWEKVPVTGFYPNYRYQIILCDYRTKKNQTNQEWQQLQFKIPNESQKHGDNEEKQHNQSVLVFLSDNLIEINLNTFKRHDHSILQHIAPLHRPEDMETGDEYDEAAYLDNVINLMNISWQCSASDQLKSRVFLLGKVSISLHKIWDQQMLYCFNWKADNIDELAENCESNCSENIVNSDTNDVVAENNSETVTKNKRRVNIFENLCKKFYNNCDKSDRVRNEKGVSSNWKLLQLVAQEPLTADSLADNLKKVVFMAYWNDHLYLFLKRSANQNEFCRNSRLHTCQYLLRVNLTTCHAQILNTQPSQPEKRMSEQTRFKFTQVGAKVYAVCARVIHSNPNGISGQQNNQMEQMVANELWSIDLPTLEWTCHQNSNSSHLPRPLPKMIVCANEQTLWAVYREQKQLVYDTLPVTGGEVFGYRVPLQMPSLQMMLKAAFFSQSPNRLAHSLLNEKQ